MNGAPAIHGRVQAALLAGIALNAVFLVLAFVVRGDGEQAFSRFVREDGFVEWLQFLVFVCLALLLLFVAFEKLLTHGRPTLLVAGLLGFAAAVAFAAVEEVSWFQRVLGVETPEFFLRHNRQAETNLHNLMIGGVSLNKHLIIKSVFIFSMLHNIVLPALAPRFPALRQWVERCGFYLPQLRISVIYLAFVLIAETMLEHNRRGEMLELFGAVHYLSTAFAAYFLGVNYAQPVFAEPPVRRRLSILFVLGLGFLVLVAWILGSVSPVVT